MRLFVGLVPPPAALDDLDAVCAPFRLARDDLRWTSRELWHLTLAFLGEVSEESLARLVPRLERAAGRHRAFTLQRGGRGRVLQSGPGQRAVERHVRRPPRARRPRGDGVRRRAQGRHRAAATPTAGSPRT